MTSLVSARVAVASRCLFLFVALFCAPASPAFAQTGGLGGTVKDAVSLAGINAVTVNVYTSAGTLTQQTLTAADGSYLATGLAAGSYYVRTQVDGNMNYMDELYNELPCTFSCTVTTGSAVTVTAGNTTSDVNFTLAQGGMITGAVTDAVTQLGLANQTVRVYQSNGSVARSFISSADGTYTIGGLPTGNYYARTVVSANYLDELYSDVPCWSTCAVTSGAPIAVTTGATTIGVNFALAPGSTVTGTVTDVISAAPIASMNVFIYNAAGASVRVSTTDAAGVFHHPRASGNLLPACLPLTNFELRGATVQRDHLPIQLWTDHWHSGRRRERCHDFRD